MRMSAELSLYPLAGDVEASVWAFIEDLAASGELSIVTNSMSTQISGETDAVFRAVQTALISSYERAGRQVLVAKFLPGLSQEVGPKG